MVTLLQRRLNWVLFWCGMVCNNDKHQCRYVKELCNEKVVIGCCAHQLVGDK